MFELKFLCNRQQILSFQSMRGSCDTLANLTAYCLRTLIEFEVVESFVLMIEFFHLNFKQENEICDLVLIVKARLNYLTEQEIFQAQVMQKIPNFIHLYPFTNLHSKLFLLNILHIKLFFLHINHQDHQNFLHSSNLKSHFFAHFQNKNKSQIPRKLDMVYKSHN